MPGEWLNTPELAEKLNVPERTVRAWRYRGTGPRAAVFGRHVRYRLSDVEQWAAERYDRSVAS